MCQPEEQVVVEVELLLPKLAEFFTGGKWVKLRLNKSWHPFTIARAVPEKRKVG